MQEMNHIEISLKKIKLQDEKISLEQDKKIHIMNDFLQPLINNVNFYNDYWDKENNNIIAKFKQLAKEFSFEYHKNSQHELNLDNILHSIKTSIPMLNYEGNNACDNLPCVNEDWFFEYKSEKNFIYLEIIPTNQYYQYPEDPDDNPYQFTYKLPIDIHEQSIIENQRDIVLTTYLNKIIDNKLMDIKSKIISTEHVKQQLSSIDFNDPVIVAELKNKLKSL